MQIPGITKQLARSACWVVLVLISFAGYASAQSTDIAWPSPVRSNEVMGKIGARDLGDPRLTDPAASEVYYLCGQLFTDYKEYLFAQSGRLNPAS